MLPYSKIILPKRPERTLRQCPRSNIILVTAPI